MRRAVAPLLVLLTGAGCFGAPAAPAADEQAPEAPTLRLLVVDDEYVPISQATVLAGELRFVTGTGGVALLHLPPGRHELRVWAPGYYRASTNESVAANETRNATVELTRRPADLLLQGFPDELKATCYVAVRAGHPAADRACMAAPLSTIPTSLRYTMRDSTLEGVPAIVDHVVATLTWDEPLPSAKPILHATLIDVNGARAAIGSFAGTPPFTFRLDAQNETRPARDGWSIEVQAGIEPSGSPPQVLQGLNFRGRFEPYRMVTAPANPSWET